MNKTMHLLRRIYFYLFKKHKKQESNGSLYNYFFNNNNLENPRNEHDQRMSEIEISKMNDKWDEEKRLENEYHRNSHVRRKPVYL